MVLYLKCSWILSAYLGKITVLTEIYNLHLQFRVLSPESIMVTVSLLGTLSLLVHSYCDFWISRKSYPILREIFWKWKWQKRLQYVFEWWGKVNGEDIQSKSSRLLLQNQPCKTFWHTPSEWTPLIYRCLSSASGSSSMARPLPLDHLFVFLELP